MALGRMARTRRSTTDGSDGAKGVPLQDYEALTVAELQAAAVAATSAERRNYLDRAAVLATLGEKSRWVAPPGDSSSVRRPAGIGRGVQTAGAAREMALIHSAFAKTRLTFWREARFDAA